MKKGWTSIQAFTVSKCIYLVSRKQRRINRNTGILSFPHRSFPFPFPFVFWTKKRGMVRERKNYCILLARRIKKYFDPSLNQTNLRSILKK